MELTHINDFYLLEAMTAKLGKLTGTRDGFRHSVVRLHADLLEYQREFNACFAEHIMVYLWGALIGEARHARNRGVERYYIQEGINAGRGDMFRIAMEYPPTTKNLETLAVLFNQKWNTGYGGEAWGNILSAVRDYSKTSPATFIDHVVDLEHNNGTVFSKREGAVNGFSVIYDGESLQDFLDYKFSQDILDPDGFPLLVTAKTAGLLRRYATVMRVPVPHTFSQSLPPATRVEDSARWGNKSLTLREKWMPFVSVERSQRPNAVECYSTLQRKKRYFEYGMTNLQLEENLAKCKAEMLKILGDSMLNKIEEVLSEAEARWSQYTKPDPLDMFEVMQVTIKNNCVTTQNGYVEYVSWPDGEGILFKQAGQLVVQIGRTIKSIYWPEMEKYIE